MGCWNGPSCKVCIKKRGWRGRCKRKSGSRSRESAERKTEFGAFSFALPTREHSHRCAVNYIRRAFTCARPVCKRNCVNAQ